MITAKDILAWVELNPKRYYRDGKIYGLLATVEGADGLLYVLAMAEDSDDFTVGMLRDVIKLYNQRKICILTDVGSRQGQMRKALSRYNYVYTFKDGIMYSTGGK